MHSQAAVEALSICLSNPLSAHLHHTSAPSRLSSSSRVLHSVAYVSGHHSCVLPRVQTRSDTAHSLGRFLRPATADHASASCSHAGHAQQWYLSYAAWGRRRATPCSTFAAAVGGGSGSDASGGASGGGGNAAATVLKHDGPQGDGSASKSDGEDSSRNMVNQLQQLEADVKAALKGGDLTAAQRGFQRLQDLGAMPSDATCESLLKSRH